VAAVVVSQHQNEQVDRSVSQHDADTNATQTQTNIYTLCLKKCVPCKFLAQNSKKTM